MSELIQKQLALLPRDGLSLRDGSGWGNLSAGRGRSLDWPFPTTLLGALRTAVGRHWETVTGKNLVLGTWIQQTADVALDCVLASRRPYSEAWSLTHRLWPLPADAIYLKGKAHVHCMQLCRPTSAVATLGCGRENEPPAEALCWPVISSAKPLPAPPWWTEADFAHWLLGQPVICHTADDIKALQLTRRNDIHLSIDPASYSYREGFLFSADILETLVRREDQLYEWAITLDSRLPKEMAGFLPGTFTLGGDMKLAMAEPLPADWFAMPDSMAKNLQPQIGLRLFAVTPACFAKGWLPDGFQLQNNQYFGSLPQIAGEILLQGALVGRSFPLSGWDLVQNKPKAIRRLVPPGSVYFVTKANKSPFTPEEIHNLWMVALGGGNKEGLGRFVPGFWSPISTPIQGECGC
ncbi:MAG: hypothetical protein H7832_09935 [Magnetococcus sp. DMHC-6]